MAATYEPIATYTVSGSSTATVTFDSLPGTFTDLRLVGLFGQQANAGIYVRVNNDSGTNYSRTRLLGNGSAASSARSSNGTSMAFGADGYSVANAIEIVATLDLMSYANTNVYKTALVTEADAAAGVVRTVNLWRSTSAVTRIDIINGSTDKFVSGSQFLLFGIKAA